jgi:RHS repeat-associated protein
MRYLLLFLFFVVQVAVFGCSLNNRVENTVQKTLTSEKSDLHARSFLDFRYQGQYEDVETGLYYNRFRYYSPESGTFVSRDPLSIFGGFNLYSYTKDVLCLVDPLGWTDIWYRALHPDDMTSLDTGGDINAKMPDAKQPPTNHVNFGSEGWYSGDQYVSMTRDQSLAEKWARDSGTDVVEIDMDKSNSNLLDLSTPEGRNQHIFADSGAKYKDKQRAARLAGMMQEGLAESRIENGAVTRRYTPPSCA